MIEVRDTDRTVAHSVYQVLADTGWEIAPRLGFFGISRRTPSGPFDHPNV
jgi:hypothetical protein